MQAMSGREAALNKPTDKHDSGKPSSNKQRPALGMGEAKQFAHYQQRNSKILWGIFSLLLILVVGVVFVLPGFIAPPDPESTRIIVTAPVAIAPENQISPFEEAQRLREREKAQSSLASLLELQEALQEKEVLIWNETQYNEAIAQARLGDEAYREQEFISADEFYLIGLGILQTIETQLPEVFARFMAEGSAAILASDAALAEESFSLAILVNPDDGEAVTGYDRAQILPQVLELLEAGSNLHSASTLEAARNLYRQALDIDGEHVGASDALALVSNDILERDFSSAMSAGYASIRSGEADDAEASFQQALNLKPGSVDATVALQQASDQITFDAISIHLSAAAEHENNEDWEEALAEYITAIEIDPNVVSAVEGRNRSNSRNNLDVFMISTINSPLRLSEDSLYNQATRVLNDAARINNPGPKLREQLTQLNDFLEKAKQAVNVQLQSDGITDVTLYRIGALGQFTSHTLPLLPGSYTAVGVREGYRDVREEFVVSINGQVPVITILCDEQIL